MLTGTDIAELRKAALSAMVDTCDILRRTTTTSPTGGQITSWVYHSTHPALLTAPSGEKEKVVADRITTVKTAVIRLPASTNVLDTDKLRIGGWEWNVAYVLPTEGPWDVRASVVVSRA